MALDALVVGAGPTGLTMALALQREGLRLRVVDASPTACPDSRAVVVHARTLEVFDELGLAEAAVAAGVRVRSVTVVPRSGRPRRLAFDHFPDLGTRYPFALALPQNRTEALLGARLAEVGVRVERPVELVDLTAGEQAEATLAHPGGERERVTARWVLGCDGAHSIVRHRAGLSFDGETYDDVCTIADAEVEWPLAPGELYLFPAAPGFCAAFPLPDQRYRVLTVVPGNIASEATAESYEAQVRAFLPFPIRFRDVRWVTRYRLHRRGVDRYRAGCIFVAGDAAHIHSPVGGQGMNTGIQDAFNLAWKLGLVARGRASADLLDSYDAERHPVGKRLLEGTDRAFALGAGQGFASRALRRLLPTVVAPLLLERPRFQAIALGLLSQLKVRYKTSPLARQSGSLSGGPAPGERAPDDRLGEGWLSDAWRGARHVLLTTGPAPWAGAVCATLRDELRPVDVAGSDALRVRYGADRAYVIRPDRYVGWRGPLDEAAVRAELALRFA